MSSIIDGCRFTPTLGGTTDWTFSAAVIGYNSPALAGVVNSSIYTYRAESADLSQWEIGTGAYNTGTGVLARTTVLFNSSGSGTAAGQSGAGTKITFATVPQVAIVAIAEDLVGTTTNNSMSGTQNVTNATDATSSSAGGAFTIAGGLAVAKKLFVGAATAIAGAFKVTDTTEATGAGTTASGLFAGGLEVAKKFFAAGIAAFTAGVASTTTTTGSVVITGGLGVSGDINFTGSAWTAYTPSQSSSSGSYSTSGRYKQIGKTVHVIMAVSCTASGNFGSVGLPITAASSFVGTLHGKETAVNALTWSAAIAAGGANAAATHRYDASLAMTTGFIVVFSGTYEVA